MVVGEGKADEDECAGKPANDAFHSGWLVGWLLVKHIGQQSAEHRAIDRADIRVAGQRAGPGRAPDKFVITEAEHASDANSNNEFNDHGESLLG